MSDMSLTSAPEAQESPVKSCGSCMLCCKLFPVKHFDKPAGKWCVHSRPGTGCTIHESRPNVCRAFQCEWTLNGALDDSWHPLKAKFFIYRARPNQDVIMVDPGTPHAWKAPAYYPKIKQIAAMIMDGGGMVMVSIGNRRIVVLPDRDEDLGLNAYDKEIHIDRFETPQGPHYKVVVGDVEVNPPQEPV